MLHRSTPRRINGLSLLDPPAYGHENPPGMVVFVVDGVIVVLVPVMLLLDREVLEDRNGVDTMDGVDVMDVLEDRPEVICVESINEVTNPDFEIPDIDDPDREDFDDIEDLIIELTYEGDFTDENGEDILMLDFCELTGLDPRIITDNP